MDTAKEHSTLQAKFLKKFTILKMIHKLNWNATSKLEQKKKVSLLAMLLSNPFRLVFLDLLEAEYKTKFHNYFF